MKCSPIALVLALATVTPACGTGTRTRSDASTDAAPSDASDGARSATDAGPVVPCTTLTPDDEGRACDTPGEACVHHVPCAPVWFSCLCNSEGEWLACETEPDTECPRDSGAHD